jgi:hypothetical protein
MANLQPDEGQELAPALSATASQGGGVLFDIMGADASNSNADNADSNSARTQDHSNNGVFERKNGYSGELLNRAHGNGLQVTYEFLRQPSIYHPDLTMINVHFHNTNPAHPLKQICVAEDGCDAKEVKPWDPVATLGAGMQTDARMHIDFAVHGMDAVQFTVSVTDHHDDTKTYDVKLRPVAGELIRKKTITSAEFAKASKRLSGLNEASKTVDVGSVAGAEEGKGKQGLSVPVAQAIMDAMNVSYLGAEESEFLDTLRFSA